jgi:uroporphyrinogen-III decarboxylase
MIFIAQCGKLHKGGKRMLTKRQNMKETMKGGHPDRFVNCYEAIQMLYTPVMAASPHPTKGGPSVVNSWGVTLRWPDHAPGGFPVHDQEHVVIKDIEHWKDYVTPPSVIFPDEAWAPFVAMAERVDRNEYFVAPMIAPGVFEQCHYLLEISNCLTCLYTNPDEMHELIDMITDWEIAYAEQICKYLKPDAVFHHDDWGSQTSSFMSPAMFEEFLLPAYKRIYGYYKAHGAEIVIHHSDSYGKNLVPYMIEMGMDVWQGVMSTNDIPELIRQYGGQLTFMGGIDNGKVDRRDWTREAIHNEVFRVCRECGPKYFIPCTTVGGPASTYPGVFEAVTEEIDSASREMLK